MKKKGKKRGQPLPGESTSGGFGGEEGSEFTEREVLVEGTTPVRYAEKGQQKKGVIDLRTKGD